MRLSNKSKVPLYNFYLTVINLLLFAGIIAFLLEILRFNILGNEQYLLLIVPVLLLAIFILRGKQIFEYDSDGEAINFKNRNIFPLFYKNVSDEFPKYKVIKYEVKDLIVLKRLYLTISSKKKNFIILKYDISYLTKKELNDLKFSLNKVIKNNREKEKLQLTQ
ncbi:hypothetical protein [Halpernia frigidisoli]|uniref:Photosystem I assembly protein Ycf4 n=1 Tax=Halpernia frigidisoli TaxID=1125876 RepID=A0A1I3DN69_9FLAO|nr:hypothetical protein [Halpernia frigidisoli]SFH88184.1 hypothetical protein SAMN05443292_0592 [Halpernia frigidisoli]